MKKILIKFTIIITIFLSIQVNSYALTLEDLKIEIDKEILHPKENVTISIDFGRLLSEFEVNIAYDKNLFEYYMTDSDINLNDNGDIVTLTYPTMSTTSQISSIKVTFKVKDDITSSNPTNFKITLQNMKDGLTSEMIDNPLLPTEKKVIVEPVYKEYKFYLEHYDTIISDKETTMKLILKSEMGQNYSNTKIYSRVTSDVEGDVQISAIDSNKMKYNLLEEGWGGELGEPIGGANIEKELSLTGKFSDEGNYKITFELQDLNNSNFIIASETFDVRVKDSYEIIGNTIQEPTNTIGNLTLDNSTVSTNTVQGITNTTNTANEVEYKPTTLPKAGSTIYFLILPIGGILILIYCLFKKKDDEL